MRTKLLLTVLCILFLVSVVAAQDTLWTRTYGGSDDDWAISVQQTADGGYIIAGSTDPSYPDSTDWYLIKTDASGDTIWTRTYGGSSSDHAYSVQQTTDGGYIVTGWTSSFGAGSSDVYLLKTDASGDTLWTRAYGGTGSDWATSVQQTTDSGYIIAGVFELDEGNADFWLLKTDASGDTLWTRTYGGSEMDIARSAQQTTDGGYIITGYSRSFGAGGYDVYLVKTDTSGDTLWTRTYGGGDYDGGWSVQQTSDGGYVIAGHSYSFGAGGSDVYLLKTDSSGDTLWTRTYGGINDDYAYSVQQTTQGGYVLAGDTYSFGAGDVDVYLVETDSSGDSVWTRTYGGTGEDVCRTIRQTTDDGYVVVGWTYSFGAGLSDVYLLRLAGEPLTLTIVPGDTLVSHNDTLCYHLICHNHTPDYLQLWFKAEVRLPNGQMYGPIFGPARFGMFGNGISEGDMCHRVPPQAPVGDYWLFAEVYNVQVSASDSMAFTITADAEFADIESPYGDWRTVVARMGDEDLIRGVAGTRLPTEFALERNYPNPFNAMTVIEYQLPVTSDVKLEVYNLLGQRVASLVDEKQQAGYRSVVWDASEVSSGLYFYKLTAGDFTDTRRMLLVK